MLNQAPKTVLGAMLVWVCGCMSFCRAQSIDPLSLRSEYAFAAETLPAPATFHLARLPRVDTFVSSDVFGSLAEQYPNTLDGRGAGMQHPAADDSGFRVVPYGWLWGNMVYATQRTNPGPYTFFVFSSDVEDESAFNLDARGSRIGVNVEGPPIPGLPETASRGRVEVDFLGQFVTENVTGLRLRHAYWEIGDGSYRLLVGQNWDVVSPLNPGVLNIAAGWFSGNIGFRRAQFRGERYFWPSDDWRIALQGSLNQAIVPDFPDVPGVRRESVSWPVIEGRFGLTWRRKGDERLEATLGVSGHIGQTGFDFLTAGPPPLNLPPENDTRFRTWSFNVDLQFPITPRFGVQGEFFTGANLSTFFGGIGQGVCPCVRVPIRSSGGWGDLWYDWTPWLHSHVGFGLDDPVNSDSLFGRTYNQFIFANLLFNITEKFSTGIELTCWKTLYQERRRGLIPDDQLQPSASGESVTIEWMVRYEF